MPKPTQINELVHRFIIVFFAILMIFSAVYTTAVYAVAPFVEVEASTTIGTFQPLNDNQDLILETKVLAIANVYLGETSPNNFIFYIGGYPSVDQTMTQENLYFTWLPSNHVISFWLLHQ